MSAGLLTICYLLAGVCFIISLGGLSNHGTAKRGALFGTIGIILAISATLAASSHNLILIATVIIIGAIIGMVIAVRVEMTAMPQLVAILHSFVGLAAVLIGFVHFIDQHTTVTGVMRTIHHVEMFIGVVIGALTFTGSVVAWGKLQGLLSSRALLIPARHLFNIAIVAVIAVCGYYFIDDGLLAALIVACLLAFILGAHMVLAIGGADMPVVVSMLNSYSGWTAAATGFLLANDLLIVTGALVGSSGAILSYIMCRAMNRSFLKVILGGFGMTNKSTPKSGTDNKSHSTVDALKTVEILQHANRVIIVPGYGMAVAQAQHSIKEISQRLTDHGVKVTFAIHPVAGRLPGHMNVLLAEAGVPYNIVAEMEEINDEFQDADTVLVIGANDIVNPSATYDSDSSLYGMPVLSAWLAKRVIVMKRSMASGYAGIDNPLFYRDNTSMLFGDAKETANAVLEQLQRLCVPQKLAQHG